MAQIKILVVDDSLFMRRVISEILELDPQLHVVGTSSNGADCLKKIKVLQPDVVTLDIDMPGMNGMSVIRHIMIKYPIPIVVFSSLFCYGDVTFEALQLGVVDFVPKPSGMVFKDKDHMNNMIIDRVKNASGVNINNILRANIQANRFGHQVASHAERPTAGKIITLGAGLSGTNSVIRLVSQLSPTLPGAIVVLLEIAPQILPAFVKKFNERVPWEIILAEKGQVIKQGACYIGSHDHALRVVANHQGLPCFQVDGKVADPLNTLFKSCAGIFHNNTVGMLLTGLGDDGAEGFSQIQEQGGVTIAQSSNCCVFPNLTQNAIDHGTVSHVVNEGRLHDLIHHLMRVENQKKLYQSTYALAYRFKMQAVALQTTAKYSSTSSDFQKYISNLVSVALAR